MQRDAIAAGLSDDGKPLRDGGTGATAYAEAVGVYLAFAVGKAAEYWMRHYVTWESTEDRRSSRNAFARQAIPMTWDYRRRRIRFRRIGGQFHSIGRHA